jgi:hypothetical protein
LFSLALALLLQQAPATAAADQTPPPADAAAETVTATLDADAPAAPVPAITLPAATSIKIALEAQVGSKVSQTGQSFPIRLVEPVVVDGVEVLPAGLKGEGQVVHAKKGGMAGSAGELVLAARYLDFHGRRIELRSFKFLEAEDQASTKGKDNVGLASATNAVIGPLGFLIGGGNTLIEPGTIATAKTRNVEVFTLPEGAAVKAPAAATVPEEPKAGESMQ